MRLTSRTMVSGDRNKWSSRRGEGEATGGVEGRAGHE